MTVMSRRQLLARSSLAGLAALLPADLFTSSGASATTKGFLVFTPHEADVVREASARLIPGPEDDPSEAGHPGAREADVVRYIDTMLGALDVAPPKVFAGGPFSNRAGSPVDDMATFIGLTAAERWAWTAELAQCRTAYEHGVQALDALCGGDFSSATPADQDAALGKDPAGFTTLLFSHAIEGMYSNPEYGGNRGLVGWQDIFFPGDVAPRGYSDAEVSDSDGPDRYHPRGIGAQLIALIKASDGK